MTAILFHIFVIPFSLWLYRFGDYLSSVPCTCKSLGENENKQKKNVGCWSTGIEDLCEHTGTCIM